MRTFNFKTMRGSRERKLFYIDNYNKPITEEEFVAAVRSWKKKRHGNSRTRSVSIAKYQYRRLKRVYGFFTDAL